MPPKKSKAAAAASKPPSASQPEPSRPMRTSGRKRRHSDTSNISDAPSSVVDDVKTPAKRRKRKAAAEPEDEAIVEIDEQEQVMRDLGDPPHCDNTTRGERDSELVTDSIEVTQSQTSAKHVHFGSDTENVDPDHATASFITPHPRAKMTVKRRTLSPHLGDSKRVKESRTSLPAVLSQDGEVDPVKIVSEWEFKPLNAVLEKRIAELRESSQRSSQRSFSQNSEVTETVDEDMLVLDSHEEIAYPQLPGPSTPMAINRRITDASGMSASERSSTKLRVGWDAERHRFHEAILQFQKEAERAKGDLQILSIEVQSLGFAEDESALDVLSSIRESFDNVREFLEEELPGTVPENASNEDLVEILIANVKEFADRLRTADRELVEKGTLNADLGNQVTHLIDRLAGRDVKSQELQEQLMQLDESKQAMGEEMQELQEMLEKAETERNERQADFDEEAERTQQLDEEKAELELTLDRLQKSLQDYQTEESRLTELITTMEEEHRTTVQSMNAEREETIRDLEGRLDAETERREETEKEVSTRQELITTTENDLQALEGQLDALSKERDELQAELDEETKGHDATQDRLSEAQAAVEELEGRIARVEEDAEAMEEQLATLREQNQTEREQREGAEQALDERDQEVEQLNVKLREQGREANELRLKAHDIQTKNGKRIAELEQQMSEHDAEFQTDMADEIKRREDAEGLAQERAVELRELQEKLTEVEQQMRDLLAERDARIEELEEELERKTAEILNLQDDLRTTEDNYKNQIREKDDRAADLEDQIAELDTIMTDRAATIQALQQRVNETTTLNETLTENHAAEVQDLTSRLRVLEAENEEHVHDKASLERRVESEAMQMLEVSNNFSEQIADLQTQLRDKQAAIVRVEGASREAEQKTTELLAAREEEVETWKTATEEKEEVIASLEQEKSDVHRKFKAYVRKSMDTVEGLRRQLEEAKRAVDEDGEALGREAEDVLVELEGLQVPRHEVAAKKTAARKVKGKKGKRVVDSGVGLGAEEGMEEPMLA
ncbi:uncharacterized protein LTR77_010901 [Saxophila tyrrhenica]|uniref:Uncharacterized protein n=1 Tax=Saxophila tyrrhenica TaxID=1690608 RepID=A0AAV9NXE6_9PEZI|nr:hypothetical protein LTR77_010901 [Saxophila tyrrhenica]